MYPVYVFNPIVLFSVISSSAAKPDMIGRTSSERYFPIHDSVTYLPRHRFMWSSGALVDVRGGMWSMLDTF